MAGMPSSCPFCTPDNNDIVAKNGLCYAIRDRHPVAKGHMLIIPYRHEPDYFSLSVEERHAMADLAGPCRDIIAAAYAPVGYNIGVNVGNAAGQSVMHCHCHIIPRYQGDSDNPRGGIRGVVQNCEK